MTTRAVPVWPSAGLMHVPPEKCAEIFEIVGAPVGPGDGAGAGVGVGDGVGVGAGVGVGEGDTVEPLLSWVHAPIVKPRKPISTKAKVVGNFLIARLKCKPLANNH